MASSSNNRQSLNSMQLTASGQNNLLGMDPRINPPVTPYFTMPIHPMVQSKLDMSPSLTSAEVTNLLYFQRSVWGMNFRMERLALEREKEEELRHADHIVRQHSHAITAAHMFIENLQQTVANLQQIIDGYENAGNAEENDSDSDDARSEIFENEVDEGSTNIVTGNCRLCRRRLAEVVLLPCRHLCLCVHCSELMADMPCTICQADRNGAVRVRHG